MSLFELFTFCLPLYYFQKPLTSVVSNLCLRIGASPVPGEFFFFSATCRGGRGGAAVSVAGGLDDAIVIIISLIHIMFFIKCSYLILLLVCVHYTCMDFYECNWDTYKKPQMSIQPLKHVYNFGFELFLSC